MTKPRMTVDWDRRFLDLAKHVSTWSKDPSTQVGAVVARGKDVVGIGYNGFPAGIADLPERYADRELKYKLIVHAEVNALLMAKSRANNSSLYVYPAFAHPNICNECCKVAIQCGVREIVGYRSVETPERLARWAESIKLAEMMLTEAGIDWRIIEP